jgi:hypothetical protein
LAALVDADAFLPLTSADLSNPTPLRVYQHMELADAVIEHSAIAGVLSTKGFKRVSCCFRGSGE